MDEIIDGVKHITLKILTQQVGSVPTWLDELLTKWEVSESILKPLTLFTSSTPIPDLFTFYPKKKKKNPTQNPCDQTLVTVLLQFVSLDQW